MMNVMNDEPLKIITTKRIKPFTILSGAFNVNALDNGVMGISTKQKAITEYVKTENPFFYSYPQHSISIESTTRI